MSEIIILSGSPSAQSGTDAVLNFLGATLKQKGISTVHLSVKDFPPADLFEGRYDSPAVQEAGALIKQAKGAIVGSPVYKAAYSGVLKALLDILPQDVFEDTPVLPLMTGGSPSHLLAVEYSLKPLLATLKAQNLKGVYLLNDCIDKQDIKQPIHDLDLNRRLEKQLDYFVQTVNKQKQPV
ncbi:NADPH-dependent FMN reductase [Virgibacillus senegalensis]|uniref:NADPH-dependent FMN reductase n=1 Tax=Virgibacillus senegalensis TaxID=1499679 RepID=UPI00069E6579|nr:NADPH-dependent FMN reductase [Virgibacillus senegalensis]